MRLGLCLPQFRGDARPALAAAEEAERVGLDGVFAFDHLWPPGSPGRPALHGHTLLAAIAARTSSIAVGTLVARVGLVPDDVLVDRFATLAGVAPGRVIAGLGTGDSIGRAENEAYGIGFGSVAERRAALSRCAHRLAGLGLPVWLGGTSAPMVALAADVGAAVNMWGDPDPHHLASLVPRVAAVTWAGTVDVVDDGRPVPAALPLVLPETVTGLRRRLAAMADAGATWAVCAPVYGSTSVEDMVNRIAGARP